MVDHEVDAARLDHRRQYLRASRAQPLAGRAEAVGTPKPASHACDGGIKRASCAINDHRGGPYEFMLALRLQGLSTDQGNDTGRQAREYLTRCDAAMSGLPASSPATWKTSR